MPSYFSKYSGAGQLLPAGYMETASKPGQYLAQGISSATKSISDGIDAYLKKRDEHDYAKGVGEGALQPLMQKFSSEQGPPTSDKYSSLSEERLAGVIGDRYAKMLRDKPDRIGTQDWAAIATSIGFYEKRQQQAQAEETQNLQRQLLQMQVAEKQQGVINDNALAGAWLAQAAPTTETLTKYNYEDPLAQAPANPFTVNATLEQPAPQVDPMATSLAMYAPPPAPDPGLPAVPAGMPASVTPEAWANYQQKRALKQASYDQADMPALIRSLDSQASTIGGRLGRDTGYGIAGHLLQQRTAAQAKLTSAQSRLAAAKTPPPAPAPASAPAQPDPFSTPLPQLPQQAEFTPRTVTTTPEATPEQHAAARLQEYRRLGGNKPQEFINAYNAANPDRKIYEEVAPISGAIVVRDGQGKQLGFIEPKQPAPGKPIDKDIATQITKMGMAIRDVDKIKGMRDAAGGGEVEGLWRQMAIWDKDIVGLNKAIATAVPGLARAMGEVGPLSENDVRNYSAMLPNIRTPDDAVKLVTKIVRDKLYNYRKSYINFLRNNGHTINLVPEDEPPPPENDGTEPTISGTAGPTHKMNSITAGAVPVGAK